MHVRRLFVLGLLASCSRTEPTAPPDPDPNPDPLSCATMNTLIVDPLFEYVPGAIRMADPLEPNTKAG